MPQKISPFVEAKFGWDFGEDGWNGGMDENLLKFSYLFNRNVDSISNSLPTATNGAAVYLTTDKRLYFCVNTSWYSCPTPKWATFYIKTTGQAFQFNGTDAVEVPNSDNMQGDIDSIQLQLESLGSAAYRDESYFATQPALDLAVSQAATYTDTKVSEVEQDITNLSTLIPLSTSTFGILSLEQGATDPAAEAVKWEQLRVAAQTQQAQVFIPAGTYVLPQGVRLDADNSSWEFHPRSVLKLTDVQVSGDFIIFSEPVNQRIKGLQIDANRASQNSQIFGEDRCACIVVDADGCLFEDINIISSPAKGFAVVSSEGGINRDVEIRGFRAKNCNDQALLVDGNNMLGFFDRITIDGVRIGATSHAGVALNDGAHNITLSNVIADVQNETWAAVAIRDGWDIQLSNIRGKRGQNGVQIERLNGYCGRIQLDNVVGELSSQNGLLFLGVEDINAGTVVGRNNGVVGINIASTSGGTRCKNITIAAPSGYDDRATKLQQWGILVYGTDVCRLGNHIAYGNTTRDVSINRSNTTDIRAEIVQSGQASTGNIAAGGEATVSVTLPVAMDDEFFDVSAYVFEATGSRGLSVGHVVARTPTVVSIMIFNTSGTTAHTGTLHVTVKRSV